MSRPFERYSGSVPANVTGTGEAARGLIRVVVGADGRVLTLSIAPELLRLGPREFIRDSEDLAAEITAGVNAALDDLSAQLRAQVGMLGDRLGASLDQIAADFERTLDQVATDITRAERRLER